MYVHPALRRALHLLLSVVMSVCKGFLAVITWTEGREMGLLIGVYVFMLVLYALSR